MTNPKRRLKILQCLSNSLTKLHSARPTGVKLDRPRRTVHPKKKSWQNPNFVARCFLSGTHV